MLTRGGKKYELSISISPIYNAEQKVTGAIGVFRDISKEKEIERQRNEFVSTASHEMRTPVAAIEGYISLAMNAKVATIDDRAMNYLTKAHENTQHLGELFRDLLSITKLEEGLIAKHLAPVNLTSMLQDITGDMQLVASKKNLSVTFAASSATGKTITPIYTVMADPERLREVIMNLVDNAIKFTTEGGITLGLSGDAKTVTVRVQDTGPGIAAEDIPHLFQKFYRVDSSATRTVGGTGLGLYLCRTLVELFNGRIWVESEVGKGSSFNFMLPRIENQTQAATVPSALPQPGVAKAQPVPIPIPGANVDGLRGKPAAPVLRVPTATGSQVS
jgi:signal transduction histidine kinase